MKIKFTAYQRHMFGTSIYIFILTLTAQLTFSESEAALHDKYSEVCDMLT